mmetsp:Transcript_32005/g.73059  ORF Transcript_32005/g.73059 Transcript_32005/m.73059 type:complete len:789 (+) Transcript_32005:114-2480(+)
MTSAIAAASHARLRQSHSNNATCEVAAQRPDGVQEFCELCSASDNKRGSTETLGRDGMETDVDKFSVSGRSLHSESVQKPRMSALTGFRLAQEKLISKQTVMNFKVQKKLHKKLTVREALKKLDMATSRDAWVVNPENNRVVNYWDLGTMVALVYVALITPVEVALLEPKLNALFIINVVVDCIFFVDMILQFFIVYRVRTPYGYRIETSQSKIIRNYVRTWFGIDLLSVLPYSYVSLLVNSTSLQRAKVLKTVRLLRLIKLVRVVRASRVFQRWETSMAINYNSLRFWTAIGVLLVSSHWIACIWGLIANETEGSQESWLDHCTPIADEAPSTPLEVYFTALYWSSITVTSVGYGDVIPVNFLERVVCTVLVFTSGLLWAYALGEIMTTIANTDMHAARFRQCLDDLNYMMKDQAIPKPMQRRLRSFFFRVKDVQRVKSYKEIVSQLSPSLQGEVYMTVNEAWVRKVWYFNLHFSDLHFSGFLAKLSRELDIDVFAGLDVFYEPWTLYTLQIGVCVRDFKILKKGAVWGEDFILTDESLLNKAPVLALTFVQVAIMRKKHLMTVLTKFPEVQRNVIRKAAIHIACVRGMWKEAQRRSGSLRARRAGGHHFMDFAQVELSMTSSDVRGSVEPQTVSASLQDEDDSARLQSIKDEQVKLRGDVNKLSGDLRSLRQMSDRKLGRIEEQLEQLMRLCGQPSITGAQATPSVKEGVGGSASDAALVPAREAAAAMQAQPPPYPPPHHSAPVMADGRDIHLSSESTPHADKGDCSVAARPELPGVLSDTPHHA